MVCIICMYLYIYIYIRIYVTLYVFRDHMYLQIHVTGCRHGQTSILGYGSPGDRLGWLGGGKPLAPWARSHPGPDHFSLRFSGESLPCIKVNSHWKVIGDAGTSSCLCEGQLQAPHEGIPGPDGRVDQRGVPQGMEEQCRAYPWGERCGGHCRERVGSEFPQYQEEKGPCNPVTCQILWLFVSPCIGCKRSNLVFHAWAFVLGCGLAFSCWRRVKSMPCTQSQLWCDGILGCCRVACLQRWHLRLRLRFAWRSWARFKFWGRANGSLERR